MEAVPSLCASGTVGVAAIGFAFGHPQHSIGTRPLTTTKKSLARGALHEIQRESTLPSTPSPLPSTTSASTSRLRKRSSLARPLSSANRLSEGDVALMSTPSRKLNDQSTWTDLSSKRDSKRSSSPGSFPSEIKGTGTARSSWLRRMSTLSSLRTGSPVSPPQPESPSLSFSNGSIAPFLPPTSDYSAGSLPRNKLVKRSSSQRALQANNPLNSPLRRPATSHQRTATVRHYNFPVEESYQPKSVPTAQFNDLQEDHQAYDDSLQTWLPFFTTNSTAPTKEGFPRKRNSNTVTNRRDSLSGKVPNVNGLPTLLLASSISSGSSNNSPPDIISQRSDLKRPSTAVGFESFTSPSPEMRVADARDTGNLKSRHSFSLADMFSYSSPASWKTPKNGSLRKNKRPSTATNNRRISSAPHPPNIKQETGFEPIEPNTPTSLNNMSSARSRGVALEAEPSSTDANKRILSTHIPPIDRFSSFEVDLPTTAPPYSTSPREEKSASLPAAHSPPSPSVSPPPNFITTRNKNHRPSGAPSDHASTLLGSDHDTSRCLSSDDDDLDYRSDTIYDSTRTRTTGSSHSGIRKLPIQAMFDEPPQEKVPKHKLIALEDLLSNESFVESHAHKERITEGEQSLSTTVQATLPCKEDEYPTSIHATSKSLLSNLPSSPPIISSEAQMNSNLEHDMVTFQDDPDWSLGNIEHEQKDLWDENPMIDDENTSISDSSSGSSLALRGLSNDTTILALSNHSKSDQEWSGKRVVDEEFLEESSPRPKTVQGIKNNGMNRSRLSGRRGSNALHLRSQSVPVPQDASGHRSHKTSKLFGTMGASEEWDGDFEFEEPSPRTAKHNLATNDTARGNSSSGMLVPRAIMERQASVRGQFGQVKELTLLVEELKQLQQQARIQGIMQGQSVELWKEAEGIINLATLDDDGEFFPPRSPPTSGFELDLFDEDSPSHGRRKLGFPSPKEDKSLSVENAPTTLGSSRSSLEKSNMGTPPLSKPRRESILSTPPMSRPRKESTAQAKSVLENIHQQRSHYDADFSDAKSSQKKLPFDTTSLRDLVTRAGVVTRALKEIVRRAESSPSTPKAQSLTPPDPPPDPLFSQIFHQPPSSPSVNKSPRVTQSPKSSSFRGGSIAGNDNEINGHMKMMTVV